jgi:hypothetical protein
MKYFRTVTLVILGFSLTGCAFMNREKRPLLNALDRTIQPQNPWAMVTLAPVMVPVGFVAGVLDTLIIYPATRISDSAGTINQRYFRKPEEPMWKKSALFVPRHIVAVPDFIGLWSIRSFVDLHPYGRPPASPSLPEEGVVLPSESEGLEIRVLPGGTPPGEQPPPGPERKP